MKKSTKTIIAISAFLLLLIIASYVYNLLLKKAGPQAPSLQSQSETVAAPDFIVYDANGKSISLSDFRGKPVVLNFWASWCPPCKAEMPDYQMMFEEYSKKGVVFIMVNMTDGSQETTNTAKQFLKDNNYTFTTYFDENSAAANAYNISAIPDSIFIDKTGKIINSYRGMIDAITMKTNIELLIM